MKKKFGKLLGGMNSGRRQRSSSGRRLRLESLEARRLLAADLSPNHNYFIAEDVNMDFVVSPMDALLVINALNQGGARSFGEGESGGRLTTLLDVNGDKMLTPMDALTIINRLNAEGEDPAVPYVAFSYNVTDTSGVPIVGSSVQIGQTFRINVSVQDVRPNSARSITDPNDPRYNLENGIFTASQDLGVSNLNVVSYVHPTTFFSGIRFDAEFGVGREGGQGGGIQIAGALSPTVSDGQFFSLTTASGTKTFEYDITGTPAVTSGRIAIPLPTVVNFQPMIDATINAIQGAGLGLTPVDRGYQLIGLPTGQFTFDAGNSALTLSVPSEEYFNEIRGTVDRSRSIDPVGPVALYSVDFLATASGAVTFTPNKADLSTSETSVFGGQAPIPASLIAYGAPITINVVADPTAPVAVNDTLSSPEDAVLILGANVTANDTVTAGRTLSIDSVSTIAGVTVGTVSGTTYTPPANFFGQDKLTYVVKDSTGLTSSVATITINVTPVNDPPTAFNDLLTVVEGSTANSLNLLADNGSGADIAGPANETSDTITITRVGPASGGGTTFTTTNGGVVTIATGGKTVNYVPASTFVGTDTFVYTITDSGGLTASATVTVAVVPLAPHARDDSATGPEGAAVSITVLANDTAHDGATGILKSFTNGANGTVARKSSNTASADYNVLVYTPTDSNFYGIDKFTYVFNDSAATGADSTATVTVTITDVNDPPVLTNDSAATNEDTALTIPITTLLSNDSPGLGEATYTPVQTLKINSVSAVTANAGTVQIVGTNVVYTPAADFNGQFLFTYVAQDSGTPALSATATVTVTVAAVNDNPIANPDTVNGTEDTTLNIPAGGTPIVAGDVRFNDRPGPATATDEAGQTLTVTSVSAASSKGGTVSLAAGVISYTPAKDFNGSDTFTYTLSDGAGGTATGTVTVNVAAVNDAPTAFNDSFSVDEDSTANSLDLLADNGSGADIAGPANETSDSITITRVGPASGGGTTFTTANGGVVSIEAGGKTVNYVPAPTFNGNDTFVYTITDSGGLTASATVTVDVAPATLPRARGDSGSATEGTAATIAVLANDTTNVGATGIVKSFTNGANGTVARKSSDTTSADYNVLVYTSTDPNFYGIDKFTYRINDSAAIGPDSTATVTVTITDVNDPPILTNDTASTNEDTALTIPITTLLSNDSPGLGEATYTPVQTLKINSVAAVTANAGTVQLVGTNVVYTPAADFNGQFLFTYVAQDSGTPPLNATATVTVSVAAVNDNPIANPDTVNGTEDTTLTIPAGGTPIVAGDVRFNDRPGPATATDEVNQTLTVTGVSNVSTQGGTVSFAAGVISYTPVKDFNGTDTFTYTLSDGAGGTATGTVTVNVAAVNDPPVAGADSISGFRNLPITLTAASLLANDNPGGGIYEASQTLSITAVSATADTHGSVVLASDGTITYTPDTGFSGAASFVYTLRDSGGATSTGTVSVNVREFVPSTIQGTVYSDNDGDEVIDSTERKLGGMKVTLTGQAPDGSALPSQSQLTLADGSYSFTGLGPGTYTVSFTPQTFLIDAPGPNSRGSILVNNPAGTTISNQNFTLQGSFDLSHVANGAAYQMIIDQFASSRFPVNGSSNLGTDVQNVLGGYFALGADNSLLWSTLRNVPTNPAGKVEFSELVLASNGTDTLAYLTVVDTSHKVTTRTLSLANKDFFIIEDSSGAKLIGVRGAPAEFEMVDLSTPPFTANKYLDSVDQVFAEHGWDS
ncbi:MAG: Ig-like domain-containing protein [Pirellulaceae bacterium]